MAFTVSGFELACFVRVNNPCSALTDLSEVSESLLVVISVGGLMEILLILKITNLVTLVN